MNYFYSLPVEPAGAALYLNSNNMVIDYYYFCKTEFIKRSNVYKSYCYPFPGPCEYLYLKCLESFYAKFHWKNGACYAWEVAQYCCLHLWNTAETIKNTLSCT